MNRRLRSIALPIWYTKNSFEVYLRDYDRSVGIEFAAFAESIGIDVAPQMSDIFWGLDEGGDVARENLLKWVKCFWKEGSPRRYEAKLEYNDGDYMDEGENAHLFLAFVIDDWKSEWKRASKDKRKMVSASPEAITRPADIGMHVGILEGERAVV